jgi:hypothetical protein
MVANRALDSNTASDGSRTPQCIEGALRGTLVLHASRLHGSAGTRGYVPGPN